MRLVINLILIPSSYTWLEGVGFYLMERVIKANPDKCGVVIKNETPTMKKKIMKSNGILTTLRIFISRSSLYALLFYMILKNEVKFD